MNYSLFTMIFERNNCGQYHLKWNLTWYKKIDHIANANARVTNSSKQWVRVHFSGLTTIMIRWKANLSLRPYKIKRANFKYMTRITQNIIDGKDFIFVFRSFATRVRCFLKQLCKMSLLRWLEISTNWYDTLRYPTIRIQNNCTGAVVIRCTPQWTV